MLEHPDITWCERTGYPADRQEDEEREFDEDLAYEEARDERMGWNE